MPLPSLAALKLLPWRLIGGGVLVLAVVVGTTVWYRGQLADAREEGKAEVQAKWDKAVERGRKELEKAKAKALAQERQYASDLANIREQLRRENESAQANADQTIANLHANIDRMRDRFKCKAATTPAGVQEATSGLSVQDGAFLIREAARADQVVREHNARVDENIALHKACSTQ